MASKSGQETSARHLWNRKLYVKLDSYLHNLGDRENPKLNSYENFGSFDASPSVKSWIDLFTKETKNPFFLVFFWRNALSYTWSVSEVLLPKGAPTPNCIGMEKAKERKLVWYTVSSSITLVTDSKFENLPIKNTAKISRTLWSFQADSLCNVVGLLVACENSPHIRLEYE